MSEREPLLGVSSARQVQRLQQSASTLFSVPVLSILGCELCERLAFTGLALNLVNYLTKICGFDPATAVIQLSSFIGSCYITPLIGAALADSSWGRYLTIFRFAALYFVGTVLLTLSSFVPGLAPIRDGRTINVVQAAALFTALALIALGTGGIKPNVSAFGADQFDEQDPRAAKSKATFFSIFYLVVNLGSIFGITVVVSVQEKISWTLGFAIPAVAMAIGIILYVSASHLYVKIPATTSPLARMARVLRAALRYALWPSSMPPPVNGAASPSGQPAAASASATGNHMASSSSNVTATMLGVISSSRQDSSVAVVLPREGAAEDAADMAAGESGNLLERLIWRWQAAGGPTRIGKPLAGCSQGQVREVRLVMRLIPLWLSAVVYAVLQNSQMASFWVTQANLMNPEVRLPWGATVVIPSATLAVINTITVVVMVLVVEWLILKPLRKQDRPLRVLTKIGIGFFICMLATATAATVEAWRLYQIRHCSSPSTDPRMAPAQLTLDLHYIATASHDSSEANFRKSWQGNASQNLTLQQQNSFLANGASYADGEVDDICKLSILWQMPQYFLLGTSEVFASVGLMEAFYADAPLSMRSCCMALQLLGNAVGSYTAGLLIACVRQVTDWLPSDLNQGRLDLYFALLVALMAITLVFFRRLSASHRPVVEDEQLPMTKPPVEDSAAAAIVDMLGNTTAAKVTAAAAQEINSTQEPVVADTSSVGNGVSTGAPETVHRPGPSSPAPSAFQPASLENAPSASSVQSAGDPQIQAELLSLPVYSPSAASTKAAGRARVPADSSAPTTPARLEYLPPGTALNTSPISTTHESHEGVEDLDVLHQELNSAKQQQRMQRMGYGRSGSSGQLHSARASLSGLPQRPSVDQSLVGGITPWWERASSKESSLAGD